MKKVFTTGQVAKICKVAPGTVAKWYKKGRIKGYRIPGSDDRRFPREQLVLFLKENGMPLRWLDEEVWYRVLLIGTEKVFNDRLLDLLPETEDYKLEVAHSSFVAGRLAESFHPDTVIVDLDVSRPQGIEIAGNLHKEEDYPPTLIVGLADETEPEPDSLKQYGFTDMLRKPFDVTALAEKIRTIADTSREDE
jgi:excisionase family DNA binding protein